MHCPPEHIAPFAHALSQEPQFSEQQELKKRKERGRWKFVRMRGVEKRRFCFLLEDEQLPPTAKSSRSR